MERGGEKEWRPPVGRPTDERKNQSVQPAWMCGTREKRIPRFEGSARNEGIFILGPQDIGKSLRPKKA
jgi:hypothetical protein